MPWQLFGYGRSDRSTKLIRGLISETPAGFRSRRGLNYDDSAPVTPHNAPFPTYKMRYFDSREIAITARHVMASGALPPAFPAVRIDGELYWDGGILSNTPTEAIFEDFPRRNSLIFAVHMWNPMGPEPDRAASSLEGWLWRCCIP